MQAVTEKDKGVPPELQCSLCNALFRDAVLIPCCGNSFCDECKPSVLVQCGNSNNIFFLFALHPPAREPVCGGVHNLSGALADMFIIRNISIFFLSPPFELLFPFISTLYSPPPVLIE
jgi:hypothetical protein